MFTCPYQTKNQVPELAGKTAISFSDTLIFSATFTCMRFVEQGT